MSFIVKPTAWEIDHASAIFAGQAYAAKHDFALPDTPMWGMLEHRHEIAPMRFQHWHPNVALMIARAEQHRVDEVPPCLSLAQVDPPCFPVVGFPPKTGSLVTPEPCAASMLLTALAVGFALFSALRLRRELNAVKTEAEPDGY